MRLKVHSIELHAKLLRGCALARTWARWHARGPDTSHAGPTLRAWARHFERGPDTWRVGPILGAWTRWYARGRRPGAYLGVDVRVTGLTRMFSGSRASDTPGQAPLCSQRRRSRPRHPVVGVCDRGGLHCGRHIPANCGLTAPNRGLTDSKRGELRCTGTRA